MGSASTKAPLPPASDAGDAAESDLAQALRWGGCGTSSYLHRQVAARLAALDRGNQFKGERVEGGLFDFQAACAEWLVARFASASRSGYALVEMDAGCGKTRALGAFLKRLDRTGRPALYVTPGGLVRQTVQELGKVGLECCKAESTKEFLRHSKRQEDKRLPGGDRPVFVVNAALTRTWMPHLSECSCLVLDEAHRFSVEALRRIGDAVRACAVVLASATPAAGSGVARLAHAAAGSQHFVMLKTPALASALNMSGVRLVADPQPPPPEHPHCAFLDALAGSLSAWLSLVLLLALARADAGPVDSQVCEGARVDHRVTAAWVALWTQQLGAERRAWSFGRRCRHEALGVPALMAEATSSRELAPELCARMQEQLSAAPADAQRNSRPLCACCGLQEEEIQGLASLQRRWLPAVRTPCPCDWSVRDALFVRAILRLPSAEEVHEYRRRVASRSQGDGGFVCCYVASDLCAAQRAIRVRSFSRARCSRAAFAVLRRSGLGQEGTVGAAVARIGEGALLSRILEMAADRALLVCDARCGDVGYNLQCTTHMVCPHIPRSSEEVLQLVGRSSRITPGTQAAHVELMCMPRQGTGESLLLQHVQRNDGIKVTCRELDGANVGKLRRRMVTTGL